MFTNNKTITYIEQQVFLQKQVTIYGPEVENLMKG